MNGKAQGLVRGTASLYKKLLAVCLGALLAGCGSLPSLEGRVVSVAAVDTEATRLGRAIAPRLAQHPGRSGIRPLGDGHDAFAARMLLARTAERTLDVQYYIWDDDNSGRMLLAALHAAAERGVRVRLLLDDNGIAGLDETLAALHAHPNLEVRLFNPFTVRSSRAIGYLTDFGRLNRRMHNKSFTADYQATIVGGRNVGDAYFGVSETLLFVDLDVLAVGPAARDVSADFDRYWASQSAYPLDLIVPAVYTERRLELITRLRQAEREPASAAYVRAVRESGLVHELTSGSLALEWATTHLVSDDPAKGLGQVEPGSAGLLRSKLSEAIGTPTSDLTLVSAYFVPAAAGTDAFASLARSGVKVSVLTNALEATDVVPVHAGYARRRDALLDAGVRLWELRRTGPRQLEQTGRSFVGSSASSLHAKTFVVDDTRVFVGSFNFDPRSLALNTELGLVIDSPVLARDFARSFERSVGQSAYEVMKDDQGKLVWLERRGTQVVRHHVEPGSSVWRRAAVRFMGLLPIEWLL